MSLLDVWRNINREIGVYWKGRFDEVPQNPGVYAWFFPLRLTTRSLEDFVSEIHEVMNYDPMMLGPPIRNLNAAFSWSSWKVVLGRNAAKFELSEAMKQVWARVLDNEETFESFRRSIMKASILMPPLYVGKTDNLRVRCQQHLEGSGMNDFHGRFERFATERCLFTRKVSDLVFACIRTEDNQFLEDEESPAGINDVLEAVLKVLCSPPYSAR